MVSSFIRRFKQFPPLLRPSSLSYFRPRPHQLARRHIRPFFHRQRPIVQRVAFRRTFNWKTFGNRLILFSCAYYVYDLLLSPRLKELDANLDQLIEEEEKHLRDANRSVALRADADADAVVEEEEEDDVFFIPLGYPALEPGDYYSSYDPEWHTFADVAETPGEVVATKMELEDLTAAAVRGNTPLLNELGSPTEMYLSWIMHEFPYRAPPVYVQSGIEITDNAISYVKKRITLEEGQYRRSIFDPFTLKEPLLAATKVLWERKMRRLKRFLGLDSHAQDTTHLDHIARHPPTSLPSFNNPGREDAGRLDTNQTHSQSQTSDIHPYQPSQSLSSLDLLLSARFDFPCAVAAFRAALDRKLKGAIVIPPRGVYHLHGMVGFRGPKGICTVYSSGLYHPDQRRWYNTKFQLVSYTPTVQMAKGHEEEEEDVEGVEGSVES